MAVLLCLAQTASAVAAKSPEKTASGNFFADPNNYTGETAPETLQPQWEIDPAATQTASGRQDWLSADPIGEGGGLNLYAYCYGNPLNLRDPDGMMPSAAWWGGFFDFDQGTVDALKLGAMATADGFIPFSDPFQESGGYSGCEDGAAFSKAAGGIARDAALAAVVPNIGAFAKNPAMYELGSTTVPTRVFNMISHLDPVSRGRILTQMNGGGLGGMVKTAFGTSWKYVGANTASTLGTGLTPGGNLAVIAGIHVADKITKSNGCP